MRARAVRTFATVSLLAVLAACNSGGGLSKEDFIAQADAICKELDGRIEAIPQPQSPEELESYAEQVLPILDEAVERLRGLDAPSEDAETIDGMLDLYEEGVVHTRAMAEAAGAGDEQGMTQALQDLQRTTQEGQQIAKDYGFADCAED